MRVGLQINWADGAREKKEDGSINRGFLINLIDSSGHVDFSSEVHIPPTPLPNVS